MNIDILSKPLSDIQAQALVLTVFEDEKEIRFNGLDEQLNKKISRLRETKELTGKYKEFTWFHTDGYNSERILIMGLGKKSEFSLERLMAVSAVAARNLRRINLSDMAILNDFHKKGMAQEVSCKAIVEGIGLGLYKFKRYTKEAQKDYRAIKKLTIALSDNEIVSQAAVDEAKKAQILAESTNRARDLVNMPANYLTPQTFADEAKKIAKKNGIKIKILEKDEIEKEGMNAFLAVNYGSKNPPKLVVMEYNGGQKKGKVLGLVGKGITFDSGGLSLKPSEIMFRMHCDMAGAAAVLSAMESIAKNKVRANVVAVMPLTENLVDAHSYKVGDVVTSREGKTIEILNTDAEGRLILADALSYIRSYKKIDYLVDIATLTGAIVTALGHFCTGAMTNSQHFYSFVQEASKISGEKVWQLPLFDAYKAQIKSDIADLENTGGRPAGSITAACFLKEFIGGVPWVHLDIAGTAWMDESTMPYVKNPFLPKEGGTGAGTRLLYHLAEVVANE